jgi:hypothetical protein
MTIHLVIPLPKIPHIHHMFYIYVGLARTICMRCTYGIFSRDLTKYTVIYGVYTVIYGVYTVLANPISEHLCHSREEQGASCSLCGHFGSIRC